MTLKLQQKKVFGIDLEKYKIEKRIEESLVESKSEEEVLVFGSNDGVYCFDGKSVKKLLKEIVGFGSWKYGMESCMMAEVIRKSIELGIVKL